MIGKRVVVTGMSAVTPLGVNMASSWENLVAGKSGIAPITQFDTTEFATKIAGEVKNFDPEQYIPAKNVRRMERFTQFSVACSMMLLEDAGWEIPEDEQDRVGCIMGCGLGGLEALERAHTHLMNKGPRRVTPFMIPTLISNMAPGMVSMFIKAKGPNFVCTSACASGIHGIGTAYTDLLLGRADAVVTGGVESTISAMAVGGFNALKALSTRNDEPERASRPFDKDRDGFVMGEGCGMMLLETLEHARERGAAIYAEVAGYGASGDAYHMTAPDAEGAGMAKAMQAAIREAGMAPEDVEHINAHATSTPMNDTCETRAMKIVFGDHAYKIPVTANKSMTGHLLGGAGGVESVFSVLTLREGVIPGTINLDNPDPECDLDYVADGPRTQQVNNVLCNSFGFGGTNASIIFKRFED